MIKITEIKIRKFRTVHEKDSYGNRTKRRVHYYALRPVNVVSNGKRIGHYLVDTLIIVFVAFSLVYLTSFITNIIDLPHSSVLTKTVYVLLLFIPIETFYYVMLPIYYLLFEHYTQRTPGKYITGTFVINEFCKRPSFGMLVVRSVVRLIPVEPFSCFSGLGWHDRMSKTFVVPKDEMDTLLELLKNSEILNEEQNNNNE